MVHACHVHSFPNAHTRGNCPKPSPGISQTAHGCSTASLGSLSAARVALGHFPHISLPACSSSRLSIPTNLLFLAWPSPHDSIHFSLAGLFTKPFLGKGVCACERESLCVSGVPFPQRKTMKYYAVNDPSKDVGHIAIVRTEAPFWLHCLDLDMLAKGETLRDMSSAWAAAITAGVRQVDRGTKEQRFPDGYSWQRWSSLVGR